MGGHQEVPWSRRPARGEAREAFVLGGLDNDKNASEIKVYRCFGEDDLRWIAKACDAAAAELRLIENMRRRRLKPRPKSKRSRK